MSSVDIQPLFEAVRRAASSSTWSRGVELVRADAVSAEPAQVPGEIALRVATRGGLVSYGVTLLVDDEEWSCECAGTGDVCEHVAAAVITLRRAKTEGRTLVAPPLGGGEAGTTQNGVRSGTAASGSADVGAGAAAGPTGASGAHSPGATAGRSAPGRLRYLLSRVAGTIALERVVVSHDATGSEKFVPITTTLAAIASGRVDGPRFVATQADLAVERALGSRLRGPMAREAMPRLLEALAACPDVRLDGAAVRTSAEPLLPHAFVEDTADGQGFVLRIGPDPTIRETFGNGVAVAGDALRPLAESRLSGREREDLVRGKRFEAGQVAALVGEVLPDLERRLPVVVRTKRLPSARREPPRLVLETRREGDVLAVLPLLVYGSPPVARVDAGNLVLLEDGAVPLRDEATETRLVRQLSAELGLVPGRVERVAGAQAIDLAARLGRFRADVRGSAHRAFFLAPALVPQLRLHGDDFSLDFTSGGDDMKPSPRDGPGAPIGGAAAVLRAWRDGGSVVPLTGGGFAPLPQQWLAQHGQRVADLLAAKGDGPTLPRAALPDLARLATELGEPPPPGMAALRALLAEPEAQGDPALPDDLTATLRSYQKAGVAWLQLLRRAELGALLADDMGLGKTLQALCAIPVGVAASGAALVVSPTSVLHNWMAELARFRPGLRASLYHGPKRSLDASADVVVTSYALLRLEAELFTGRRWAIAILDEAQNVKNPESQLARTAHRLDAAFRIALTGTPVENRLDELWSELRFATPGLLGSQADFAERVARPIADGGPAGAEAALRLRERIRPFVLRRRKRDVAPELPPRTDLVLRVELDDEERAVYDAVRAAARRDAVAALAPGGNVLAALEALLRLRQAACHAALVPGQQANRSSKLDLLLEELETVVADGHKALVFSQWTRLLDLAEPALARAEIPHLRLDGTTRDRAAVVSAFQDDAGPPVLLVSLRAGGTGLNLTAADHVFLLDPWWNPAVEDQAADRAHRIGQERPVLVYRLVAKDTVEEAILALQEHKRGLGELALGETDGAAGLRRDELARLLERA